AGRRDEVFADWKRSMSELAKCPNVVVKLGGMVNRGAAYDFHNAAVPPSSEAMAEVWRPYVETCIELFGPQRCMFESNFPVDKMAIGYKALWNAFKRIAAGASQDEKLALFCGTAARGRPPRGQKGWRFPAPGRRGPPGSPAQKAGGPRILRFSRVEESPAAPDM